MRIFDMIDANVMRILKIAAATVAGVLVVAFVVTMAAATFQPMFARNGSSATISMPSFGGASGLGVVKQDADYAYAEDAYAENGVSAGLSIRNIVPRPPVEPGSPSGTDAEAYEVTDYGVTIETRDLARDCGAIAGLKAREDIIFEYSNEYDHGCTYTFKVKSASAEGVLALLKAMDPKDVNENTRTIKRLVDDFTSETEVLMKKRASIDATMADAIKAYDEITRIAATTRDADALARIIDSKLGIIERLTNQRIAVDQQIERLSRAKADELDRVDFVFFNVSVSERKFVDGEQLADSWRDAIRQFVRNANAALQMATVGMLTLLFVGVQYALYALLILLAVKYGWKFGKRIWKA